MVYQETRDEAEHSLRLANYAKGADADEHSWILLSVAEAYVPVMAPYEGHVVDPLKPHPFIRHVRHILDNCTGTNKSQFVKGTISITLALGILDAFAPYYGVVGHTKFECDITAQKTACSYHRSDTFNMGMLRDIFQRYATTHVYDGTMLRTWKEAEKELFAPVGHITSYRLFLMIGDDGLMELNEITEPHARMAAYTDLEGDGCSFFTDVDLERELESLKGRSLRIVLQQLRNHSYSGIGAGAGKYCNGEPSLFPPSIESLRHVRMFKKIRNSDTFWVEQTGYQKVRCPQKFCKAIQKAQPYATSMIPGQCPKAYWGARAQQIRDQYAKFVPPMYVPDEFEISKTGCSGKVSEAVQQLSLTQFFTPKVPMAQLPETQVQVSEVVTKKRKFGSSEDYAAIMAACPDAIAIKKQPQIKALADSMGFEYAQVKSAIGRLVKKGKLNEPH